MSEGTRVDSASQGTSCSFSHLSGVEDERWIGIASWLGEHALWFKDGKEYFELVDVIEIIYECTHQKREGCG